jgi:hypothetical protein
MLIVIEAYMYIPHLYFRTLNDLYDMDITSVTY